MNYLSLKIHSICWQVVQDENGNKTFNTWNFYLNCKDCWNDRSGHQPHSSTTTHLPEHTDHSQKKVIKFKNQWSVNADKDREWWETVGWREYTGHGGISEGVVIFRSRFKETGQWKHFWCTPTHTHLHIHIIMAIDQCFGVASSEVERGINRFFT